jgi:hypothetical protein
MTDYKKIREEMHERFSKTFEKLHMSEKNDEIIALRAEVELLKDEVNRRNIALSEAGDRNVSFIQKNARLTAENERLTAELRTAADMNAVYEGRLQEKEAEVERLREALEVCDRVLHFDLRKMITWGNDYNQAVKDAADITRAALNREKTASDYGISLENPAIALTQEPRT